MQPSVLPNFLSQTLTNAVSPISTGCCHVTLEYGLILPMAGRNRVKEIIQSVLTIYSKICYFVMQFQTSKRFWPSCGIVLFSDRVTSSQRVPKWQFSLSDGCSLIWPSTNLRTNPQCSGISLFLLYASMISIWTFTEKVGTKKEYTYVLCYFATPKKLLLECIQECVPSK